MFWYKLIDFLSVQKPFLFSLDSTLIQEQIFVVHLIFSSKTLVEYLF